MFDQLLPKTSFLWPEGVNHSLVSIKHCTHSVPLLRCYSEQYIYFVKVNFGIVSYLKSSAAFVCFSHFCGKQNVSAQPQVHELLTLPVMNGIGFCFTGTVHSYFFRASTWPRDDDNLVQPLILPCVFLLVRVSAVLFH